MIYSLSNITEVADCDVLLTWAGKEKADLNFKKLSEERLTAKYADTSVELEAILQGVLAELAASETILAVLPEGPTKEAEKRKKTRLEYKKFLLETRKESYGAVALLQKQLDLAMVEQEIVEVDAFIAAVTAHKATL